MIAEAGMVVALTGAGISTESGIPDFRSPGGLWTRYDPMLYATFESFVADPTRFWSMAADLNPLLENALPNPAHLALSELEAIGKCDAVITQNIDHLHQRAGSGLVLELHGTYRTGTCGTRHDYHEIKDSADSGQVPSCKTCLGAIKPDVVLFGEPLNAPVLHQAVELATSCDLMLVIGCGLEVFPAASLPSYTHRNDGKLIFINLSSTAYDEIADLIILGQAGIIVPRILEEYKLLAGGERTG
jgi:NAD-dependent deacetylase